MSSQKIGTGGHPMTKDQTPSPDVRGLIERIVQWQGYKARGNAFDETPDDPLVEAYERGANDMLDTLRPMAVEALERLTTPTASPVGEGGEGPLWRHLKSIADQKLPNEVHADLAPGTGSRADEFQAMLARIVHRLRKSDDPVVKTLVAQAGDLLARKGTLSPLRDADIDTAHSQAGPADGEAVRRLEPIDEIAHAAAMDAWEKSLKRADLSERDRVLGALMAYERSALAATMLHSASPPDEVRRLREALTDAKKNFTALAKATAVPAYIKIAEENARMIDAALSPAQEGG